MSNCVLKLALFAVGTALVSAQPAPVELRVESETVPPGGGGQLQAGVTSPQPIFIGNMRVRLSAAVASSIHGVSLFNPNGDVSGAAVVQGNSISTRFTSPLGTFGTTGDDMPLMVITFTVPASALPGSSLPLALDPTSVLTLPPGAPPLTVIPGVLTIGGSLSITNVVPGGGNLPAGTVVSVLGTGFTGETSLEFGDVRPSAQVVSSTEIRVTLGQATIMDGIRIRASNRSTRRFTYYSYLRGVPVGQSSFPLIAATVPLFSVKVFGRSKTARWNAPALSSDFLNGIAFQNPNLSPVDIVVEQFNNSNRPVAKVKITLAPGAKVVRETGELLGVPVQTGSYLVVTPSIPIQMLGLLAQKSTNSVLPLNVICAP